jgi:hypothetical protein
MTRLREEMMLDSLDAGGRASVFIYSAAWAKQQEKGQLANFGEKEMENNGNTGYKTKKSRPTVSTRPDLFQQFLRIALCRFAPTSMIGSCPEASRAVE